MRRAPSYSLLRHNYVGIRGNRFVGNFLERDVFVQRIRWGEFQFRVIRPTHRAIQRGGQLFRFRGRVLARLTCLHRLWLLNLRSGHLDGGSGITRAAFASPLC